jgi:hypothetical protein
MMMTAQQQNTTAIFFCNSIKSIPHYDFWCLTPFSAILWRLVLVVEEAGTPRENHRPWASNW